MSLRLPQMSHGLAGDAMVTNRLEYSYCFQSLQFVTRNYNRASCYDVVYIQLAEMS